MEIGSLDAKLIAAADKNYIRLFVTKTSLVSWCINLCSLEKEIIENIKLKDDYGRLIGLISMSSNKMNSFSGESFYKIKLMPSAIDYWLGFLLRYLRAGIAEVDHIDIDAGIEGEISQDCSIILMVDEFLPPMSSDEMNKLLEL